MIRMLTGAVLVAGLGFCLNGPVWAHTESELANVVPPHGGLLASSGDYHVELVLKPDRVQVFVTDRVDKPVSLQGVAATANLRVKGKKAQRVALQLTDDHLQGLAVIPADAPVTVMIMLKIGGNEQMVPYVWPAGGPARKSGPAGNH